MADEGFIAELQGCVEEEQAKMTVRRAVSVLLKVTGRRKERERIEKVSNTRISSVLELH